MKKNMDKNMNEQKVNIRFGILSPPIRDQLKEQGLKPLPGKSDLDLWEKLSYAISLLSIHGFISDSVKEKCFEKLFKKIMKELNKNGG